MQTSSSAGTVRITSIQIDKMAEPVTGRRQAASTATDSRYSPVTGDALDRILTTGTADKIHPPGSDVKTRDISPVTASIATKAVAHSVCRDQNNAPGGYNRVYVPDDKVSWNDRFDNYQPTVYTAAKTVAQPSYADPMDPEQVNWRDKTRQSHMGEIKFNNDTPLNPAGRTGTAGRGELAKWGPNHAADAIITRDTPDGKLELLLIRRKDNGQWALPGGKVNPQDKDFLATAIRELMEEALNSDDIIDDDINRQLSNLKNRLEEQNIADDIVEQEIALNRARLLLEKITCSPGFAQPDEIYKGYVDDRRNTDNAWMETTAYHIHTDDKKPWLNKPVAGDDAGDAQWVEVNQEVLNTLYANHATIVLRVPNISAAASG